MSIAIRDYIPRDDSERALRLLPEDGSRVLHDLVVDTLRHEGLSEARAANAMTQLCCDGRATVRGDGTWRWAARKV